MQEREPAPAPGDTLADEDFRAIAAMLRAETGITLSNNKRELVSGRLSRRLRALRLPNFTAYRAVLDGAEGQAERREMVNALTTNLTSFFRESHHFDYLAETVMPAILAAAPRRVRLWSAACSSGEEAYSMAMVMQKALAGKGPSGKGPSGKGPSVQANWDARVLGTDIDSNMVAHARKGIYPADRAAAIPSAYARMRVREADDNVAMPEDLKALITFNELNLLGTWPMHGPFDAIFCRNVVIYFDKDTQRTLFDRIADILAPRGTLFIGHSETLFRVSDRFESLGRTIYRKIG